MDDEASRPRCSRTAASSGPSATLPQRRDPPDLCPAFSLTDLFQEGQPRQRQQVTGLLDAVPTYFQQGAITRDRKTANLAFGIRLQPLDKQREVVNDIKDQLKPPPGVEAEVVGLPVLVAEANGKLSSPLRRAFTLAAALLAVFLVLWAVRRSGGGPRAPDPDRAGHRLVGRSRVRTRPAARSAGGGPQPDVGDPGSAGDRDLHGVQRAALLALRARSARREPVPRARWRSPTAPPARPCWPRGRPPSPASQC